MDHRVNLPTPAWGRGLLTESFRDNWERCPISRQRLASRPVLCTTPRFLHLPPVVRAAGSFSRKQVCRVTDADLEIGHEHIFRVSARPASSPAIRWSRSCRQWREPNSDRRMWLPKRNQAGRWTSICERRHNHMQRARCMAMSRLRQ